MIPAVIAALEQTLGWGVERDRRVRRLRSTDTIAAGVDELGLRVAPTHLRAPHLLGIHLGDADPEAVAAAMADARGLRQRPR